MIVRLASFLLLFSLVACTPSEPASVEPWIVTGIGLSLEDRPRILLSVEFTGLTDQGGSWRFAIDPGSSGDSFTDSPIYRCWQSARIGDPLPECMRSFAE